MFTPESMPFARDVGIDQRAEPSPAKAPPRDRWPRGCSETSAQPSVATKAVLRVDADDQRDPETRAHNVATNSVASRAWCRR
jgi:hypothetical protein